MSVIKFHNVKRRLRLLKQLNHQEIRQLIIEGVVTIAAMSLIYFGCLFLFQKVVYQNSANIAFAWRLVGITEEVIHAFRQIFLLFMVILTVWLTNWRLARRYRQFELNHVLSELHYIASGHYEHRIDSDLVDRLGSVVNSINHLVDSTVNAMAEERRVEQTKQELVTNVSHDIRTPLTSIIGYLALIKDEQYDDKAQLQQFVTIAYQKAQQMKKLTDSLFEYSKMQHQDNKLEKRIINIEHFLTQVALEYETEATKNNMAIQLVIEQPLLTCKMDGQAMARVFDNLLSNAFKYSQGTQITLSAKQLDEEILFYVANNGKMITQDVINQLFVRFYREDNARSTTISGSGLGLAIVESIVHAHGGKVWVESSSEQTYFYFTLPK